MSLERWQAAAVIAAALAAIFAEVACIGDELPNHQASGGQAGQGGGAGGAAGASATGGSAGVSSGGAGGDAGDAGGGAGVASVPLNGLVLWLDATSLSLADGASVGAWPDRSPAKQDAFQNLAVTQPTFQIINGKPQVVFDGENDFLNLPTGFDDFSQGFGVFAVIQAASSAGSCRPILELSDSLQTQEIGFRRLLPADLQLVISGNSLASPDGGLPSDVFVLAGALVSKTGGQLLVNGSEIGAGALALPPVATRHLNYVGKGSSGCNLFDGFLRELLVYQRGLTPTEVQQINAYLQTKWNCCT